MKTKKDQYFSDLEEVRRELQLWRRNRRRKGPIPEALWQSITQLGRRYGVSRIARDLRVPFYALRDRVQACQCPEPNPATNAHDPFVELPLSLAPASTECVVELEDGSGSKMTLRLSPANAADAGALIQTFRGPHP